MRRQNGWLTAALLEVRRKRDLLHRQSAAAGRSEVVDNPRSQPEAPRQERSAGGRAHRRPDMEICKAHARGRQLVQVWGECWLWEFGVPRAGVARPVRAHVSVAPVVCRPRGRRAGGQSASVRAPRWARSDQLGAQRPVRTAEQDEEVGLLWKRCTGRSSG
jgi:hypothetical protein